VTAIAVGGIARLITPVSQGTLQAHAALWRGLAAQGVAAVEVLLTTAQQHRLAIRHGYLPVPIELWYWDPQGRAGAAIETARTLGWSFLETDKVI
jgi:hypothetical protein